MFRPKKSLTLKAASLALGALFLGAAAQTSFAQQEGRQSDRQRQQSQMERERPAAEADRDRWDVTDELTEGWIIVKLAARPGLGDVDVEVQDGVARISGEVESDAAKNRALRIANRTMGVRSVRDQLKVDPSVGKQEAKAVPDQQLAEQVAREIADNVEGARAGKDWWFDGWRVEGPYNRWNFVVEADDGDITLDGDVPYIDIMRKAVEAAKEVPGVRTVDSDLELERYYGPYRWPYYGRAYPYQPHVMPPQAARPEGRNDRHAGGRENQQQSR